VRRGGELVRRAHLRLERAREARHPVRLSDGTYALAWSVERPGGRLSGERELVVDGEGTIVLALSP
jgi:hypothetical protein